MAKPIISLTATALQQIEQLFATRAKYPLGLRISLLTKGCSGLSWSLDIIDEANPKDELVQFGNIKVFIDSKAILFVLGSVIDYKKTELEAGFIFQNPNETSKCGCGESFMV